jgi:hypothetical protein
MYNTVNQNNKNQISDRNGYNDSPAGVKHFMKNVENQPENRNYADQVEKIQKTALDPVENTE